MHNSEDPRPQDLRLDELQELLGDLGAQLTVEQLQALLQLIGSCEDLDEAREALEQVAKAA